MLHPEKTDCSCSKSPFANTRVQGRPLFMTWHAQAQSTRWTTMHMSFLESDCQRSTKQVRTVLRSSHHLHPQQWVCEDRAWRVNRKHDTECCREGSRQLLEGGPRDLADRVSYDGKYAFLQGLALPKAHTLSCVSTRKILVPTPIPFWGQTHRQTQVSRCLCCLRWCNHNNPFLMVASYSGYLAFSSGNWGLRGVLRISVLRISVQTTIISTGLLAADAYSRAKLHTTVLCCWLAEKLEIPQWEHGNENTGAARQGTCMESQH